MPKKPDIYDENTDSFTLYLRLQGLTRSTQKSGFAVHDFTKASLGKGIYTEFFLPGDTNAVKEFHVFSEKPISGGDMIITQNDAGKSIARLAFDVERDRKQENLYRLRTVKSNPEQGIGHVLKMDRMG